MPLPSPLPVFSRLAGAASIARDAVRAARLLREIDAARYVEGPAPLVARMRAQGSHAAPRSLDGRRQLARVIYWLDKVVPGGPNCYRRALVQVALDREAAEEPFVFGLNAPTASPHGHAWVEEAKTERGEQERFDVEFRL